MPCLVVLLIVCTVHTNYAKSFLDCRRTMCFVFQLFSVNIFTSGLLPVTDTFSVAKCYIALRLFDCPSNAILTVINANHQLAGII